MEEQMEFHFFTDDICYEGPRFGFILPRGYKYITTGFLYVSKELPPAYSLLILW